MIGGIKDEGLRVLLGPTTEFHKGVHGSLLDRPPSGVRYRMTPEHETLFLSHRASLGSAKFDPLQHPALTETVSFGSAAAEADLAHSSRLPVSDPGLSFVVDADCLLFTLQCGNAYAVANRALPDERARLERAFSMANLYSDPRCEGILLHTQHAVDVLTDYLCHVLDDRRVLESILSKLDVVYPTIPAVRQLSVRPPTATLSILVAGQTSAGKGMDFALEILDRLADEDVSFKATLVAPQHVHGKVRRATIEEMVPMDRTSFLAMLPRFDVLLMPTEGEGYGMLLVEAMAAGVVPVTSTGPNVRHARELLGGEPGAHLIERRQPTSDQIYQYLCILRSLADSRDLRERSRAAAWRRASSGLLAVEKRDVKLKDHYAAAARVTREIRGTGRRVQVVCNAEFSVPAVEWLAKLHTARAGRSKRLFL